MVDRIDQYLASPWEQTLEVVILRQLDNTRNRRNLFFLRSHLQKVDSNLQV